ncbi:hypothetical protein MLD38_004228 [Melastoma candidum]|uniref:Uncharacterized protein n=1 Tax=Melastoma candidum TaxID=119954 RepID=A0ACB9S9P1_9MYRT|nr:hypothetical protein MLD38_004228 [Melastoma candidum]
MGRLGYNNAGDDRKRFLNHSSHPHHLELTSAAVVPSDRATCFGCHGIVVSGTPHLTCRSCAFYLHCECYDFPERIRHPGHDHVLVLDTSRTASFRCKACDSDGRGFAYRCMACHQDFHCACTSKPLSVTDHSVHEHELKLYFKAPYEGEAGFRCDLCGQGCYCWLYCCKGCHFDVHIDYVKCKVARTSGMAPAAGENAPPYQTRMRSIQGSVPESFPVVADRVPGYPGGTNVTATRAVLHNTGPPSPVNNPQIGPNGSYGHGGQGFGAPIYGEPYGNNNFVHLQPLQGNSQPMNLWPNGRPPMNVQPNLGVGYGPPITQSGYPQAGMKEMFAGGIASGLGEGTGQGIVGMGMDALGMGGDHTMGSDFVDSYAGE